MKYLTRRDGTLRFQIRVPNASYDATAHDPQCVRTADLSIAQPPAQRPVQPARSKVASKTTPNAIETMDDALIYWRRMRLDEEDLCLSTTLDQGDEVCGVLIQASSVAANDQ